MFLWIVVILFSILARIFSSCAAAEAERRKLRDGPPFPVALNPFDAIACAVHQVNPFRRPRELIELRQLIPQQNVTSFWQVVNRELGKPTTEVSDDLPFRPGYTVADLAVAIHPDVGVQQWTYDRITDAWRSAQVFVGVRKVLVECLGVDDLQITRSARLVQELGAD